MAIDLNQIKVECLQKAGDAVCVCRLVVFKLLYAVLKGITDALFGTWRALSICRYRKHYSRSQTMLTNNSVVASDQKHRQNGMLVTWTHRCQVGRVVHEHSFEPPYH